MPLNVLVHSFIGDVENFKFEIYNTNAFGFKITIYTVGKH